MAGVGEASLVLGLISSVIAIVDGINQVYDAAANAEGLPEAFREVAGRLPIVQTILASARIHISAGDVDEGSCKAMQPVITQCEQKAEKLGKLFKKVVPSDDASRGERYLMAVRTLGKGGKVESLMKGILQDVQLLADNYGMRITSDLVKELSNAIEDVSEIQPSVPDIEFQDTTFTNNNYGEGTQTISHVQGDQYLATGSSKMYNANTMTFAPSQINQECEEAIINLLWFRGMDEKYERIAEAHKQTFHWIYKRPGLKFMDWLRSGSGVFWINGKAGSGKSTLMKYLFENRKTRENLPLDAEIVMFGFFFHDQGGNRYLKSQDGLFRAILHSILSKYRQLIPLVLPRRWTTAQDRFSNSAGYAIPSDWPEWSMSELKIAFRGIIDQKVLSLRLCLLIDGLDEFSGEPKNIVAVLKELLPHSSNSVVKVQLCLSSRPLIVFENAYSQYCQLRVQDLTSGDISAYIIDEFDKDPELKQLVAEDSKTSAHMMEEILEKAEGVFLWVTLVVRSLIEGLEGGDSIKDLQRRLSTLPAGLEPLYQRMVENIEPFYHEQAAQLFRIVHISVLPLSPLAVSFLEDDPRLSLLDEDSVITETEISRRHILVSKRLKARSAGLIEMGIVKRIDDNSDESNLGDSREDTPTTWRPAKVQFLHLTVKEFMETQKMRNWLATRPSTTGSNTDTQIVTCCLRQIKSTGVLDLYNYTQRGAYVEYYDNPQYELSKFIQACQGGTIFLILSHALQAERTTQKSQLIYLESLNKFLQGLKLYPVIQESDTTEEGQTPWHWTSSRFGDWSEPTGWRSDFVSYLVTIGMKRSAIKIIEKGYKPASKPGRPLLFYAISNVAPDYAIGNLERDTVDPSIIEELLNRGCNPNQSFNSLRAQDIQDIGFGTAWGSALFHLWRRFCFHRPRTEEARQYYDELSRQETAMNDLLLRWLKTVKLFLEHGADAKIIVLDQDRSKRHRWSFKLSALSIFNGVFSDFDNPLKSSTQQLLLSKGAIEVEEDLLRNSPLSWD